MSATTPSRRRETTGIELMKTFLLTYVVLWALTLGSAIIFGWPLLPVAYEWIGDRLLLEPHTVPSIGAAADLFAHNLLAAGWPLVFVLLQLHRAAWQREFGTLLLGGFLIVNASFVGAASGVAGDALVPYVVHLPVEWAALAVSATAWLVACKRPLSRTALAVLVVAFVSLLAAAAMLETYAVPHL